MKTKTVNATGDMVSYDYGDRYSDPNRGTDKRRNLSGDKPRGYQISEMWESHHEIARRILIGEKNVDIAKAMGCSEALISNVRNSPVVKEKLAVMAAARDCESIDLSKEIMKLAPIAIKRMAEALETGKVLGKEVSAQGILKEANGMLDREVGKAIQRVDSRNLNAHITLDGIEKIKALAKKLAGSSGQMAN